MDLALCAYMCPYMCDMLTCVLICVATGVQIFGRSGGFGPSRSHGRYAGYAGFRLSGFRA